MSNMDDATISTLDDSKLRQLVRDTLKFSPDPIDQKPWPWYRALNISVLQCAGTSALIYILKSHDWIFARLPSPLSPYVPLAIFTGCSVTSVLISPFLRRVCTSAFRHVVLRDGPTHNADFNFLVPNAMSMTAYFAPVSAALVYHVPRRDMVAALSLAARWCWAETLPMTWLGLWQGNRISWLMAGVAIFRLHDWRLAAFALCRRHLSGAVRPWALGTVLSEKYAYQPMLLPRHFRLLRIGPSVFGGPLRCSLEMHSLDKAHPAFDAISYSWGSGERTHMILIDGKLLPIQRSAYEVISGRASLWRTRYIWIDAVCINQDDTDDKEHQVKLMRDIYASANRAVVWLGEAPDAMYAWLLLHHKLATLLTKRMSSEPILGEPIMKKACDNSTMWAPLENMLAHSYWYRSWIVQEIVVSKEVEILYGGYWFDWGVFSTVVGDLIHDSYGLLQQLDDEHGMSTPPFQGISKVKMIANLRNNYRQGQIWPLSGVLASFTTSQASLERDWIFAFAGISTAAGDRAVMPDYRPNTSTLAIFRNAVRYCLTEDVPADHDPFLILAVAGIARNKTDDDTWPSWVVKHESVSDFRTIFIALATDAPYNASGPNTVAISASGGGDNINELVLQGRIIDRITNITSKRSYCDQSPDNVDRLFEQLSGADFGPENCIVKAVQRDVERRDEALALVESCCGETYFNGQSRWDAFWRTQIGNRSSRGYPAAEACGEDYRLYGEMTRHLSGKTATNDLQPAPWLASVTTAINNSISSSSSSPPTDNPTESSTATLEDTLDSIQRLLTFPEGIIDLRQYVTAELLRNPALLLEKLLSIVPHLPQGAADALRDFFHWQQQQQGKNGTDNSAAAAATPDAQKVAKALDQLTHQISKLTISIGKEPEPETMEIAEQRLVLYISLMAVLHIGGTHHLRLSDDQVEAIRKTSKMAQQARQVMYDRRFGLWYGSMGYRRQFAVTEKGYMALVLPGTEVGDVVGLFHGARVPFVLRPVAHAAEDQEHENLKAGGGEMCRNRKKYRVVGEAYLHGFMDGEAFREGMGFASEDISLV